MQANTAGLRKGRYPAKFPFESSLLLLSSSQEMVPHSDSVVSAKRAESLTSFAIWHPVITTHVEILLSCMYDSGSDCGFCQADCEVT